MLKIGLGYEDHFIRKVFFIFFLFIFQFSRTYYFRLLSSSNTSYDLSNNIGQKYALVSVVMKTSTSNIIIDV